jgi:hypothetical protein
MECQSESLPISRLLARLGLRGSTSGLPLSGKWLAATLKMPVSESISGPSAGRRSSKLVLLAWQPEETKADDEDDRALVRDG